VKGNITITKERFLRLIVRSTILNRLECGGVDNWEWYDESMNPEGELSMDEFEEEEKLRISKL